MPGNASGYLNGMVNSQIVLAVRTRVGGSLTGGPRAQRADISALEPGCENGSSAVRLSLKSNHSRQSKLQQGDGEVALTGSANRDRRSFELNYENNILFHDSALTGDLRLLRRAAGQRDLKRTSRGISDLLIGYAWEQKALYRGALRRRTGRHYRFVGEYLAVCDCTRTSDWIFRI